MQIKVGQSVRTGRGLKCTKESNTNVMYKLNMYKYVYYITNGANRS